MYDFDAGDLSLNFSNTMEWHGSSKPRENLKSYSDLITWGLKAGLLSESLAQQLNQTAIDRPQDAEKIHSHAIRFREAIYRIFSDHSAGSPIREDDLSLLNEVVSQVMSHLRLTAKDSQFQWQLPSTIRDANLILWPVARAAADLLTSDKANRIRMCEDDRGCGYLFIDQTKNHSRRWCSMESCGNRAKARRHYSLYR